MKAAVVRHFGQVPEYSSFDAPPPEDGAVMVDVLAAALSPRVRSAAAGAHYTSTGVLPMVPGLDGVGRRRDGQNVYFLAAHDAAGAMAEQCIADARLQVILPDGVNAATIAAGMLPAISSWVPLTQRAPLQNGQSVLVVGATGTSGLLAIQIARLLGARNVVAVGRNEAALEKARALGAHQVVRLTGDGGRDGEAVAAAASEVNVVLDYLWGPVTSALLPALCRRRKAESRALHWVLIGSASGDEITLSSVLLRKRNLHVLGSGQGAVTTADMFSAAPAIVAAFAAHELRVDAREVPLAEVSANWSERPESGTRLVFVP